MQVKKFKRFRAQRVGQAISAGMPICERLENRQLFAVAISPIQGPVLAHPASPSTDSIDLSQSVTDPSITGTVVEFNTTEGVIDFQLTDSFTPKTVANFLAYVKSGVYSGTFFHRDAVLSSTTGAGGSPTTPADIVQGGGYKIVDNTPQHIATNAPVADEYLARQSGDVPGTLAMAKTANANSATSEFYFNASNNVNALDTPTTDSNGITTSYTVFGTVLGNGLAVINSFARLPTVSLNSNLTTVPVVGIKAKLVTHKRVYPANLTYLNSVTVIPAITYTVVSDNPTVVHPVITGNTLSFQYGSGKTGAADITVTAKSVDGTTALENFVVTVPDTTAPAASVTTTADSPSVPAGVSTALTPLANDTDSLAALQPSSLAIVSAPANGTPAVNTVTGEITYTPNAGFSGSDSFQYTIADTAGNVSAATTVSITVAPAVTTVTVGTGGSSALIYTQPNGSTARLTVTGGSAVVSFATSNVQTTKSNNVTTARGAGATVNSIVITNDAGKNATVQIDGSGTATVGAITDTGSIDAIIAPHVQLTGNLNVGGLGTLMLASTNVATLTIGNGIAETSLLISNATDTSVLATSAIDTIRSRKWVNADGFDDTITAASIKSLDIAGEFADGLTLTDPVIGLQTAKVGQNLTGGAWTIAGPVGSISARSASSPWSLTTPFALDSAHFSGNLGGNITAATIGSLAVGGDLHDSSITSTAPTPDGYQIKEINVGDTISNSKIIANGNIGFVRTGFMTTSQIDAGLETAISGSRTLPTSTSSFVQPSFVRTVQVRKTFSNSVITGKFITTVKFHSAQTTSDGSGNGVVAGELHSLSGGLSSGGRVLVKSSKLKTAAAALHDLTISILTS